MSTRLRWRLASSFPRGLATLWGVSLAVAEWVDRVTDGTLEIVPTPADEPIAAVDVLGAVADGRVELGHTTGGLFLARDPVLALATAVPFGLDARRHDGWLEGDGRPHADAAWRRAGVVGLPCGNTGAQMGGWFRQPLARAEALRGLRIRADGLAALVLAELGAEPVPGPAADLAAALRRGALDAVHGIGPCDGRALDLHRGAAYCQHPGVLEPSAALWLIVNAAAWDGLAESQRAVLRLAAGAAGGVLAARYELLNPPALVALQREGAILARFPDPVVRAFGEAAGLVLDRLARADAGFAAALRSYRAFAEGGRPWHALGERGAQDVIAR